MLFRFLSLIFLLPTVVCGESFLVDNGQARAEIVIAENPSRSTRLAAQELQRYIEKITGAKLLITNNTNGESVTRIFVGRSAHTDKIGVTADGLTDGAYRVVAGKDWMVLMGDDTDFVPHELHALAVQDRARSRAEFDLQTEARWGQPIDKTDRKFHAETGWWQGDRRGSLNAVYDFLRGLGVRWFMPGELGEIVPKLKSISLPSEVDRSVRPDFAMRQMNCSRWDLVSRDEILWHFRLGLNWGGEHLGYGRRHGIQTVLERDEMKTRYPEYYAIWGGERQTDYNGGGAPCLSSEALFQEHVSYVRAMFDIFDEPMLDIAFPDNMGKTGKMCECEPCRAQYDMKRPFGFLSDYVWAYQNRLAEEVAKTHPNKKVFAYAYQNTFLPPENIEKLHPNLVVILASVWRHGRLFPERTRSEKRDMDGIRKAWAKKVTSGVLYNWDYYLFPRPKEGGQHGVPVYFPHGIAEDLRSLKATPGMTGEYIEVTRNDPETKLPKTSTPWGTRNELYAPGFSHLNVYVTGRLYWDTAQDVDELLADYYTKFYGAAAKEMQAFVEFCEQNWPRMSGPEIDKAAIQQMRQLLSLARETAGDSNAGKRIELIHQYVEHLGIE